MVSEKSQKSIQPQCKAFSISALLYIAKTNIKESMATNIANYKMMLYGFRTNEVPYIMQEMLPSNAVHVYNI